MYIIRLSESRECQFANNFGPLWVGDVKTRADPLSVLTSSDSPCSYPYTIPLVVVFLSITTMEAVLNGGQRVLLTWGKGQEPECIKTSVEGLNSIIGQSGKLQVENIDRLALGRIITVVLCLLYSSPRHIHKGMPKSVPLVCE